MINPVHSAPAFLKLTYSKTLSQISDMVFQRFSEGVNPLSGTDEIFQRLRRQNFLDSEGD